MPDISKITLPSGNTYDIKDATARQMIAGGISFNIVHTQAAWASTTAPTAANIPAGVKAYYNSGASYVTGTLAASADTVGTFYLVYSNTQKGDVDIYDEYVTVEPTTGTYVWEKIGDTQLDLSSVIASLALTGTSQSVVTGVAADGTDTVLGTGSTFAVSGDDVTVVTGVSTTKASATASGAAISAVSGDNVTVVTGYAAPTTDTFVKSVSAETGKNLVTTTVTGVQASTTTASKATAATSQTTASGSGTASSTNTDWLKGVSVANEILTIGAATMDTQTTTQFTFADVTVPIKAASATTVATGATSESGTGDAVVTGVTVGSSASALTGLGTPSTDTVIGTGSTFTVTQPTITLATGSSGDITIATGSSGTDSVWGASSTIAASGDNVTALTGVKASGTAAVVKSVTATPTMGDGSTGTASTYTAS